MSENKIPCPFQGPGQQNPEFIGGYDMIRPTDDPRESDYWISSGETVVYDAGENVGSGGNLHFSDRLRISKGAVGGCTGTVTLDIEGNPLMYSYYPPHSLDIIFVLDVTASMMSGGSRKMALAKRALIQTIEMLWQKNRETVITIIPFARDAYIPQPEGGLSYNYLGTLFTWRRSTTGGNMIGQILGYRNGSYVSATDIPTYMQSSGPIAASAELSLYNYYNYYKIRYSDIYNADGSPKPDTILEDYLASVYAQDPQAYTGNFIEAVADNRELTPAQLPYSMHDNGYQNNTILDNLIWAIPYGEDTNTEAGLMEAYNFFKTPGFAQSEDILRRAVILITDGQANRSVNPAYSQIYAQPDSVDSDFFPDIPGGPWRYFMYLQQTLPNLISEIGNRSATYDELILALQRAWQISEKLKDSKDGNASVFVLGIEIGAQTPGPYTKEDVLDIMRTIATTGSYLHEAAENSSENPIIEELERLVKNLLVLTGSLRVTITDTINTALFDYVPGSLRISGTQDGIKLKSKSAPDITDPSAPDYTVYQKPALLPDVSDGNVAGGVITVDLGAVPFPIASSDSQAKVRLMYEIKGKGSAYGTHLHTDNDGETYASYSEPSHLTADNSDLTYSDPPHSLYFQTPVVSCCPAYTVEKFVGISPENTKYKSLKIPACQTAFYRVAVGNHTDSEAAFPLLYEAAGAATLEEAIHSTDRRILAENLTVPANSVREFTFQYKTDCCDHIIPDFAVLETPSGLLYDNASIEVQDGFASYVIQYLDRRTGRRICPDKLVENVSACTKIPVCRCVRRIPCWRYVGASACCLDLCKGDNVLKLYYVHR